MFEDFHNRILKKEMGEYESQTIFLILFLNATDNLYKEKKFHIPCLRQEESLQFSSFNNKKGK